ncbi:uncharacterized protein LOC130640673 [Hydractinia symbiolongicarpus]|uniref:uncharacterized protein LOC130640673 n=1 Tax=Hydractinia symbiolongicarpus TaxID=13093 RepID=UPI00254C51D3|nr:uncharacterized protein LOC130640673 [Hydractinia symbiolongicarpus]
MVEVLSLSVYAFKQYLITLEQIINKDKSIKGRKNVLSLIKAIRNRVAGDIKEYSATIQKLETAPCDHPKSNLKLTSVLVPTYPDPKPPSCICKSISKDHQLYNIVSDLSYLYLTYYTYYRCLFSRITRPDSKNFLCPFSDKVNRFIKN